MRKFGFYFSELIIATLLYVAIMGYFAWQGYVFSPYNREISGVIFLLFGVGIAIVTYHLLKLAQEDRQLAIFAGQTENFRLAINRLLEKRPALSPEMTANNLRKTVDEHFAILDRSLLKEWVYKILNMTLDGTKPDQNALSLLLQQRVEVGGNRIRYIAGILVMIGLLGTFLGLIQSLKYLQHFFTASAGVDITTLFSDMKQTLGGLDKAFGTSIGGIMAYLVLGYLNIVLRTKQAYMLSQIEEALLDQILPVMQSFLVEAPQDLAAAATNILRTLPKAVADQLSSALGNIMQQTIGGSTAHLETTSLHLQAAAEEMQRGQATFTETLRAFGDFLTTFQEGRDQLLISQQALTSGVNAFSAEIAGLQEQQQRQAASFEMLQNYLAQSETRFSAMDAVVEQMQTIWTGNRQGFGQLAETVQSDHTTLIQIAQALETFLHDIKTEARDYFQNAQAGVTTAINENTAVNQKLLQAHTMLTTQLQDVLQNYLTQSETRFSAMDTVVQQMQTIWTNNRQVFGQLAETVQTEHVALVGIAQQLETLLRDVQTDSRAYFQQAQEGLAAVVNENTAVNQELLQSYTMLTTLLRDLKAFIRDEQQGLSVLSVSLQDTFGEARFQYAHLTEHFEEFDKRLADSQEQLAQVQETTAAIQQHLQTRRNA